MDLALAGTTFASATSPPPPTTHQATKLRAPSWLRVRPHKDSSPNTTKIIEEPDPSPPANNDWYKLLLAGIAMVYGTNFGAIKYLDTCEVDGESQQQ